MIIFGSRLYGRVDEVPSLGHVATSFFHVQFIPLIPTGSYLVVGENQGASIPLSFKSIVFAWLRALCVVAFLGSLFVLAMEMSDGRGVPIPAIVISVVSVAAFGISYRCTKASLGRAIELGEVAGIPAEVIQQLFQGFEEVETNEQTPRSHNDDVFQI